MFVEEVQAFEKAITSKRRGAAAQAQVEESDDEGPAGKRMVSFSLLVPTMGWD